MECPRTVSAQPTQVDGRTVRCPFAAFQGLKATDWYAAATDIDVFTLNDFDGLVVDIPSANSQIKSVPEVASDSSGLLGSSRSSRKRCEVLGGPLLRKVVDGDLCDHQ